MGLGSSGGGDGLTGKPASTGGGGGILRSGVLGSGSWEGDSGEGLRKGGNCPELISSAIRLRKNSEWRLTS